MAGYVMRLVLTLQRSIFTELQKELTVIVRLISRGGRTAIALPKELLYYDLDSYEEALLIVRTHSGIVSLRSRVQVGEDMIEIFDDGLLEKLTLKEPQTMESCS